MDVQEVNPSVLTEQQLREELALVYRLIDYYKMTDFIFNHISLVVPSDGERHFLINPYGLLYSEVKASNLVKIDINGNIVEKSDYPVNPAGFVIHSAIHKAREDANCVLHTHTRSGMAVSGLKVGLLPLNQMSMQFYNRVGYHDYQGEAVSLGEQSSLVEDIGKFNTLILRNHGLLTVGSTALGAFMGMARLEKACQLQVDAMAAGEITLPSAEVCEHTAQQFSGHYDKGQLADTAAPSLFRKAMFRLGDREFPDYRD